MAIVQRKEDATKNLVPITKSNTGKSEQENVGTCATMHHCVCVTYQSRHEKVALAYFGIVCGLIGYHFEDARYSDSLYSTWMQVLCSFHSS